jgi:hypothetical protein
MVGSSDVSVAIASSVRLRHCRRHTSPQLVEKERVV